MEKAVIKEMLRRPLLLITLICFVLGLSGITTYEFQKIEKDTTSVTNYGFAILAGIASVCFGWARALDPNQEKDVIAKITSFGEKSFGAAIFFIMASTVKYCAIHFTEYYPELGVWGRSLLSGGFLLPMCIATFFTMDVMIFLAKLIWTRHWKK